MPVTTNMPAPIEAPIPIRRRSSKPRRRERSRLELSRAAFSEGVTSRLVLRAEDQKRERENEEEEEGGGERSLVASKPLMADKYE